MINSKIDKNNIKKYRDMRIVFQKSIVAKKQLKKGKAIAFGDLAFKKPGKGILPSAYKKVIGRKLKRRVNKDEIIKKTDLEKI